MNPIDRIEAEQLRKDVPPFRPGDTVRVHVRVVEGDKERIQVFEGTVIRRSGGANRETFTVRKTSYGVGVERTFPVHSPRVERVEICRGGRVFGDIETKSLVVQEGATFEGRSRMGQQKEAAPPTPEPRLGV